MTGIKSYSTTASNNVAANTGINWDEGMSPAAVNNSARAVLADVRGQFNDLAWFAYGNGDLYVAPVYVSSTSIKIAGVDVTTAYHVNRRVKAVGSSTGTIYGTISSTAFSTDTTVGITWDSGSLSNEALTVYLSQIPATGGPLAPESVAGYVTGGTWTPTVAGSSVAGTPTYFKQVGTYMKIGKLVIATFNCQVNLVTGMVGQLLLSGLPFTSSATTDLEQPAVLARYANLTHPAGCSEVLLNLRPNRNFMECNGVGSNVSPVAITTYGNSMYLVGSVAYIID